MQKLMLIGRLGKDPEIVNLESGSKIAKFSMATSESYIKKGSSEKTVEVEWHNVTAFGKTADIVEKYFTKGMEVFVEGKLKTRKWEDKDGNNRYNTDVIMQSFAFIGGKSDNTTSDNSAKYEAPSDDINNFDTEEDLF